MPSRKLTRRELYDLVWAKPMTKLASEFGISDVGLKKTCDRHRVPTPPRGYWAKLEAGQKPKMAVFVEVDDARLNQIDVGAGGSDLPEPVRRIIDERRAERKEAVDRQRTVRTVDYEPVEDVHPAVRKTVQILRKAKPAHPDVDASGEGLCGVHIGHGSVERAIYVLDGIARQLTDRGLLLVPGRP